MKNLLLVYTAVSLIACNQHHTDKRTAAKDNIIYPFRAAYSSNLQVGSDPENAKRMMQVWKFMEQGKPDSVRNIFADTLIFESAEGARYITPADSLVRQMKLYSMAIDSVRYDVNVWQTTHFPDTNDDWVNIWAIQRTYPKSGKPDTVKIQENWRMKKGRCVFINQYKARPVN